MRRTFVGFGFGAIQAGLFLPEVQKSGNFDRIVVSEIDPVLVDAIRNSGGKYFYNIAAGKQVKAVQVTGVEIYNPLQDVDRSSLVEAVAEASELCTALPSFHMYDTGPASVAQLLTEGLRRKKEQPELPAAVVYSAENDTRAAKRLEEACLNYANDGFAHQVVFSETVIGKMCSIVTDLSRIQRESLCPVTNACPRAILVEAFNQVFVDQETPTGFIRGLNQFSPKSDLYPFALAKFLGQNATHATLGYFAESEGLEYMSELSAHPKIIARGLHAYTEEVGQGLIHQFGKLGEHLFTRHGFAEHAKMAVERMLNPLLADPVTRVTRDPVRKLGWDDRLVGAIRITRQAGVEPVVLLEAARLALNKACLEKLWADRTHGLSQIWSGVNTSEFKAIQDLLL